MFYYSIRNGLQEYPDDLLSVFVLLEYPDYPEWFTKCFYWNILNVLLQYTECFTRIS